MPKGIPCSEQTKAKMSESLKGNKNAVGGQRSPDHRAKISIAHKGRHPSEQTLIKMSLVQKGKILPFQQRAKMSAAHKGKQSCLGYKQSKQHKKNIGRGVKTHFNLRENRAKISGANSHRWQGGISKAPYPFAFTNELKEAIRNRDNHTCQLCGVPQLECLLILPVHHIDYNKSNLFWSNLITLCNRCNSKANWNRAYWQAHFSQLLKRSNND